MCLKVINYLKKPVVHTKPHNGSLIYLSTSESTDVNKSKLFLFCLNIVVYGLNIKSFKSGFGLLLNLKSF
jgi:hypothetical protein